MFVQVVQARVTDEAGLRKQIEKWEQDVKPTAKGFLGSTSGISEDGTFIVAARFESEEVARQNSDSPEQSAWWEETSGYLSDPKFYDCTDVDEILGGGSDDAGFVQVIQGRVKDKEKVRGFGSTMDEELKANRPDVLGGLVAWGPDNGFSQFMYFRSEAEAREAEKKEPTPEAAAQMEEWQNQLSGDLSFIDLKEPRLVSN